MNMSNGPRKRATLAGNLRPGIRILLTFGLLLLPIKIPSFAQQAAKQAATQVPTKAPAQPTPSTTPAQPALVQPAPAPAPPPTPSQPEAASGAANAGDRQKAIVKHLNSVLRFYHDSAAPIQKVGEPSDLIYRDQTTTLATQIAGFAFQSAQAEAALLTQPSPVDQAISGGQTQAQKMQATRDSIAQRLSQLKTQDEDLKKQLETANSRDIPALQQQRQQVQGELELQTAMNDAIGKITGISGISGETGFAAQISQLYGSAPGLAAGKPATVAPTLDNLSAARSAGVTSQAQVLFSLLGTRQSIEDLIGEANDLHQQASDLHNPLVGTLRKTIAQGEALAQQADASGGSAPGVAPAAMTKPTAAQDAQALAATRKSFDALTEKFKAIASASVPLSQEMTALEQSQASLQAWRRAVDEEYKSILRSLLLRVAGIAFALGVIFILGEVWRRATTRYVKDIRRRRQLLVIRRLCIGFLSGLIMIFGLVTQFSSLATFAGFIVAGLAVGLQTILLSVVAYFFIIGRYGVRVGDRITIAGVTGDVAEVGLVRFYMHELAGSGIDLYPSGRVAIFSNAVLFQAATPLYKQLPGSEYLWHEMTVKLAADADYKAAVNAMLKSVQDVYDGYRQQIELQHRQMESWMDSSIQAPTIQSNLQLVDGGLQFWARFPVLIKHTTETDDRMTESLLHAIASDPRIKEAVSAPPVIKAAVKG
jgi:small-conductance mechanosensitive channel